jgi:hypothetical protein
MPFRALATAFGLFLSVLAAPAWATAYFPFDTLHLTTGGGPRLYGDFGGVYLTQDEDNVDVLVQLAADEAFDKSSRGASLEFNLDGISPIVITDLTAGFALVNDTPLYPGYNPAGSGKFQFVIKCSLCTTKHPANGNAISFVIDNLQVSDFIQSAWGYYFAANVCLGLDAETQQCLSDGQGGNLTAAFDPPVLMPEPATIAIFGAGLFLIAGAVGFYRRRKRKSA